jgi:aspartate/glutamate racemase
MRKKKKILKLIKIP